MRETEPGSVCSMANLTMATPMPPMASAAAFRFDNSFARDLPGFYEPWQPTAAPAPRLGILNPLAGELGLDVAALADAGGGDVRRQCPARRRRAARAGLRRPSVRRLLAAARRRPRLLLGEVIAVRATSSRHASRARADAVLARRRRRQPSGRCCASTHQRGDGRPRHPDHPLPRGGDDRRTGLPRAAAAGRRADARRGQPPAGRHVRVYAARGDVATPFARSPTTPSRGTIRARDAPQPFSRCSGRRRRQASLVAQWMLVGFIHGVMNTDNMTISGETIDYGPCAFMDASTRQVFSSIDHQGRYAYANQPAIAQWNLARFAETLLPLFADDRSRPLRWPRGYRTLHGELTPAHAERQRAKLGLVSDDPKDKCAGPPTAHADAAGRSVDYTLNVPATRRCRRTGGRCRRTAGAVRVAHKGLDEWLADWRAFPGWTAFIPGVPRNAQLQCAG